VKGVLFLLLLIIWAFQQFFKVALAPNEMLFTRKVITLLIGATLLVTTTTAITLTPLSTFHSKGEVGGKNWDWAEISAYYPTGKLLFTTNPANNRLDVIDLKDPSNPVKKDEMDLSSYGGGVNSVAIHAEKKLLAVAMQAPNKQDSGSVAFFMLTGSSLPNFLATVPCGALPDMVTFTPDGKYALVANEGEPSYNYQTDPEGSITVITITKQAAATTFVPVKAGFESFNSQIDTLKAAGVRIYGPGATVAQDLEPEYITVSADSKTAWVSLQENNAFAIVDIPSATVRKIVPLGLKNHEHEANKIDGSDRDSGINIQNWRVFGMYQPDGIATFQHGDDTYVVSANEGDGRDYGGFSEECRVRDLSLDSAHFPHKDWLQQDQNLGRLKTTTAGSEANKIYSYGARSFSIWDSDGVLVWDSGSQFEDITAAKFSGSIFNSNGDEKSFDTRSDDKGSEPTSITIGIVGENTYVFIGLERTGGIMIYDVSDPFAPTFIDYVVKMDDFGPEGILFLDDSDSPYDCPLLIVTNQAGTVTMYKIE
jgi:DNA-binding beta-propeller fold protein YncE